MLLALTRLVSHWSSLSYQSEIQQDAGVGLDATAVRAIYLLGIREGAERPSVMAIELNMSRPATSKLIARMVDAQLVERTRDGEDGRAQLVRLSPAGREIFDQLFASGIELISNATSGWSPEDVDALNRLLPRFVAGLLAPASLAESN